MRRQTLACLLESQFEYFIGLPDSRTAGLIEELRALVGSRLMQVSDEATAVSIAAGLTLASKTCLVIMENSGLRRAAETLGRLSSSHGIHPVIMATDRGA